MNCIDYLKNYQEIPYKIFYNAIKNNKLFHAYLLSGEVGSPLLEIAKFLSASIIDGNGTPFEIKDQNVYQRIKENTFGDFVYLDAKNGTVKIDDIRNLEDKFSKTAEEKYGKKIYVINGVENLSVECVNALLKFLEEPLDNTYAFLLTENEFAILPTIISRVQIIHFSTINQNILLKETEEAGISSDIAELLSFFYNSAESIIEKANDPQTIKVIEASSATIENIKDKRKLYDVIFNNVLKVCTSKVTTRQYFDYLTVFFKEALKVKNKQDTILKSYDNILKDLANFSNIEGSILKLMHSRNEINFNLNNNLLIIHTFRNIFGDI